MIYIKNFDYMSPSR